MIDVLTDATLDTSGHLILADAEALLSTVQRLPIEADDIAWSEPERDIDEVCRRFAAWRMQRRDLYLVPHGAA